MKLKIEPPKELLDSLDPLKARLSALTLMAVAGFAMALAALFMALGSRNAN